MSAEADPAPEIVIDEDEDPAAAAAAAEPASKKKSARYSKDKGRRLQQRIEHMIKQAFPHLRDNDVKSVAMGVSGDDIAMSPAALDAAPYAFEAKNVEEKNFNLWQAIKQVNSRKKHRVAGADNPCVVVSKNNTKPVSIVEFGHFAELLRAVSLEHDEPLTTPFKKLGLTTAEILGAFDLPRESSAEDLRNAVLAGCLFARRDPAAGGLEDGSWVEAPLDTEKTLWIKCNSKSRFNFWKTWQDVEQELVGYNAVPALAFNRSDGDKQPCYIAIPFAYHIELMKARLMHLSAAA